MLRQLSWRKILAGLFFFAAICAAVWSVSRESTDTSGQLPWYSIVPPLLAITLAFVTQKVVPSLGVAIAAGAFLSEVPGAALDIGAWAEGSGRIVRLFWNTIRDVGNIQILVFIPLIFVTIELVIRSGGFQGILRWLARCIRGRRSAQGATGLMGVLCFIDDYANAMIVGSMMQPITDRFRISRQKLAFLVDATSAPIAGLAVISTWIAYEVGLLGDTAAQLAIDKNGYSMFFDALAYRFYCWLMIAFVFLHIALRRDFGPMRKAEESVDNENPESPRGRVMPMRIDGEAPAHPRAINAILPLGGLLVFHITGLWVDGSGPQLLQEGGSLWSTSYWRHVISAAKNTHIILDMAGLFGLITALFCAILFAALSARDIRRCFVRGLRRASVPIVILILAWTLKSSCSDLGTGRFLTSMLAGKVPGWLFPPIVFVVASITSFATGTSYGTMAILIPTATPIAFALDGEVYGLITIMSIGAVLDGAIFGDHCSPISDTTIMSSMATSCDLMAHVRTQLPYSVSVATIALLLAYLPSGLGLPSWLSLAIAVAGLFLVLVMVPARVRSACGRTM